MILFFHYPAEKVDENHEIDDETTFLDLYIFDFMRFIAISFFVSLFFMIACREEEKGMKPLDLTPYGLPMSILAPDSTEVSIKEYPFMRNINIRKDEHFHIELFELESNHNDPVSEKQRQMTAMKKSPKFLEILKEYDNGFVYSKKLDSTSIDYDFRLVEYLGDKQLIFQSGVMTSFSLEDIEQMVKAIKAPAEH